MADMRDDPAFQRLMDEIEAMPPLTPDQRRIIGDALNAKVADNDPNAAPGNDNERPADQA